MGLAEKAGGLRERLERASNLSETLRIRLESGGPTKAIAFAVDTLLSEALTQLSAMERDHEAQRVELTETQAELCVVSGSYRIAIDALKQGWSPAEDALRPFAEFAEAWDNMPLAGIGDEVYTIHGGTEYEASIRLSDCRKARAILGPGDSNG